MSNKPRQEIAITLLTASLFGMGGAALAYINDKPAETIKLYGAEGFVAAASLTSIFLINRRKEEDTSKKTNTHHTCPNANTPKPNDPSNT